MDKQLMFIYSNEMTRGEAECFAKNLRVSDDLFLVKMKNDPEAHRKEDRESFIVVRYPRQGERIHGLYEGFFPSNELISIRSASA
jgi:hypothetical protein